MKASDFYGLISSYIRTMYGDGLNCDIIMTSKRRKDADYFAEDGENKYRLVIIGKDGKVMLESHEKRGSNKARWTSQEYGQFIATLAPVENV